MVNFILLLLGLVSVFHNQEESEWKKSLDKDGIVIYTRSLPNARFHEFLAEAVMEGSPEKFKEIIYDVQEYPNWVSDSKEAKIIDRPSPNEILYYMKIGVPFPFEGRDIVQKMRLIESENRIEVEITNHPDRVPLNKKLVRMEEAYGNWTVTKVDEHTVAVKFQYYADPSGDIPAWMVNAFVVKSPNKTLRNLRDLMS